jgi:phosphatidylglycerophosphate synthase
MLLFGWLAGTNIDWLWASSLLLVLQWFTDSFDGALGRYRAAGLVRWGYYMDHLLDYFFMGSIFVGYALLLPDDHGGAKVLLLVLMLVYGGLEANSWLAFAATNQFKITFLGIGPTEIRLLFVGVNTGLILFGTDWLVTILPWALALVSAMLVYIVVRTQRTIRALDMQHKGDTTKTNNGEESCGQDHR